ncbi:MAG: hypothetical protein GWN00_21235, partial [Aliifodinibius sp.]|nr:hypothetical protein [Fodinibius sp.]NIY27239.1 hypothetical protein [Fodinibius sp.]
MERREEILKEEVPKWAISVDEFPGGRCYLSRNAYLRRWLKTTGRLAKTNEKPDILYAQVCYGALPDLGQEMTAVQSVTYVSEEVSKIEKIAAAELKITVSCCSAATIVVTHGDVHASTLKAVGVDEEKIIKVRPAPSIRAPMINKNLSSTIIGYAGQNIPRKRIGWARIAAKEAGCEILITNTTKFNMMSKWYNKI